MRILLHKNFERQYKKLRINAQKKFKERRTLFLEDEFNPLLDNHPLHGKYQGYRSINVGGDLRAVYRRVHADAVLFVAIDTHSNLYQ